MFCLRVHMSITYVSGSGPLQEQKVLLTTEPDL